VIADEIERKISDFRELGMPPLIPCEGQIHVADRMVSTVIGARRVGKSFRGMQLAQQFIEAGRINGLEQICAIDFDNPILAGASADQLQVIQEIFLKMTPEAGVRTPLKTGNST